MRVAVVSNGLELMEQVEMLIEQELKEIDQQEDISQFPDISLFQVLLVLMDRALLC